MPTSRATADTVPIVMFETPGVAKGKLTSVKIDNQGAAPRTITLQDTFTPDPSVGAPTPASVTIDRFHITIGAGVTTIVSKDELKDVEILGRCEVVANALDAATVIIVGYHFE